MRHALALAALGCSANPAPGVGEARIGSGVAIDGSSTVFPIHEAVAEEFQNADRSRRVTIGVSGTGGGMKKLCNGEIDVAGASRPVKPVELEACAGNGISLIELPIAWDGIAVVMHPDADWVPALTPAQLKRIWEPEAQATILRWNQVEGAWPDAELHLFGAGVDSGTYDYFTKAIVGTEHSSRGDYTSSEDDNVLVQGIKSDIHALGFFGLAYYEENASLVKAVPIDDGDATNGDGPVLPSAETVANGTYQPLSRPVFVYVSAASANRASVRDYIHFLLAEGRPLVREVGYVPLADATYARVTRRFDDKRVGTLFGNEQTGTVDLDALLDAGGG